MALTYDGTSGVARIYYNGQIVAQQNLGIFTPNTQSDLYLGGRPAIPEEVCGFAGLMDELAIYNRPLRSDEIRQDYNAGKQKTTQP